MLQIRFEHRQQWLLSMGALKPLKLGTCILRLVFVYAFLEHKKLGQFVFRKNWQLVRRLPFNCKIKHTAEKGAGVI